MSIRNGVQSRAQVRSHVFVSRTVNQHITQPHPHRPRLFSQVVSPLLHQPGGGAWNGGAGDTGNTASEGLLRSQFPRTFSTHHQVHLRVDPNAASSQAAQTHPPRPLRVGVVLSGGPAPGGHNVVGGLLDALEVCSPFPHRVKNACLWALPWLGVATVAAACSPGLNMESCSHGRRLPKLT